MFPAARDPYFQTGHLKHVKQPEMITDPECRSGPRTEFEF